MTRLGYAIKWAAGIAAAVCVLCATWVVELNRLIVICFLFVLVLGAMIASKAWGIICAMPPGIGG